MEFITYLALGIFGAALGSFAGAQVWRLRARQLVEDKAAGEKVDTKEYKRLLPLTKHKGKNDRSIDLDTGKRLEWYDLIPIVSWLVLRGKSRYSGKPIGKFELCIELGMVLFFVASYAFWPQELTSWVPIAQLVIWLVAGVGLAILFAYDWKWFLLPNKATFTVVGLGAVYSVLALIGSHDVTATLISIAGALLILSGLYLFLYIVSKGKWIGFGDIKLGAALALLLADWQLALLALFAANLIGTLIVIPGMIAGKVKRSTHVPFGPLLIVGAIVAQLFGYGIIEWYMNLFI